MLLYEIFDSIRQIADICLQRLRGVLGHETKRQEQPVKSASRTDVDKGVVSGTEHVLSEQVLSSQSAESSDNLASPESQSIPSSSSDTESGAEVVVEGEVLVESSNQTALDDDVAVPVSTQLQHTDSSTGSDDSDATTTAATDDDETARSVQGVRYSVGASSSINTGVETTRSHLAH